MTESIGQQLRKKREARRISLEQASQATRIRLRYLQALETDDFSLLPSIVQVRGFLRSYAQFLDLPMEPLLVQLDGGPALIDDPAAEETEQPSAEQVSSSAGSSTSAGVFQEIGARLRHQREQLGLTLEDVERNTHLRMRYLKALESGRLEDLPSPVQGRGMLSNYAVFMGMDSEELLLRFAEGLQADLSDRRSASSQSAVSKKGLPSSRQAKRGQRFLAPDFIIGFITVVVLVGFVSWAVVRVSAVQSGQEPTLTAPSVADVLAQDTMVPTTFETDALPGETVAAGMETTPEAGEPTATQTLAVAVGEPADTLEPSPTLPIIDSGLIQLYLVARQRAWARIIVDGEIELEGRVVPGSPYLFTGNERMELLTGNGAALQVFLNRQDLGPLGISGEVVQRVFTPDGMQTPTPAVSPTSRPTETATITLTPAGTPSPTPTPPKFAP